jgi:hypothetical protein
MFGFLHQTFEEYLAAMHLASPPHRAFEKLRPHLHDPRWREVTLLTAGYIGDVQRQPELAGELVDSIRTAGNSYEEILHRDLLLAAECIAERTPADRKCEQSVVSDLCAVLESGSLADGEMGQAADALAKTGHLRHSPANASKLVDLLRHGSPEVRWSVAMGLAATSGREVEAALMSALGDEDGGVAGCAAAVLLLRGRAEEAVCRGLTGGISHWDKDLCAFVRGSAKRRAALIIPALLDLLRDPDSEVRRSAAWALEKLAPLPESVLPIVRERLANADREMRWMAARLLALSEQVSE